MRTVLLVVPLVLLLAGCFERSQPTAEATIRSVQVLRVSLVADRESHAYDGVVRPRREADLGFRASGRVESREVDLGTRVSEGQVLARLDPTDLALSVRAAQAELAQAQAQAAQAASDAARSRTLTALGWVAAATDEVKQAATRAANERVTSAQAALALARNRLDYAELRAPHDGVVTALLADPGTVVTEGQAILRLAESGAPEAEIALPESALSLATSEAAEVSFWSRPGVRLKADLRELSPAADRGMRTYLAHYSIPNAPAWVIQGMTATVHLSVQGDGAQVAVLPQSAMADCGGGPMVWVVPQGGGTPAARPVQVRRLAEGRVLVTGLAEGELVVTLGVQKLDPAGPVRVAAIQPAAD